MENPLWKMKRRYDQITQMKKAQAVPVLDQMGRTCANVE